LKKKNASATPASFITAHEYQEFQKPNRFVPRTIFETPLARTGQGAPQQAKLDSVVTSKLRTIVNSETNSFACICIGVKEGDGMSWSAESVNGAAAQHFAHFQRWQLANEITTDSMPLISDFIGVKSFLRHAVVHKLTPSFLSFITLRSWMTPLIVFLAVALGFVIKSGEILQKAKFPGTDQSISQIFYDPTFYLINISLAVLGLSSQFLATYITTRTKSASVAKLVERLSLTDTLNKIQYENFVDALAQQLQTEGFPRVVIIDNFEHLDYTTKCVIDRYFQQFAEGRRGSEFWIVFEAQDGEKFSGVLLDDPMSYGFKRTQFFDQLVLTEPEKKDLVRLLGRPEDAVEYTTVKRISHSKHQDSKQVEAFFRDYRERHPPTEDLYGELEFLFLLSLTAENVFLTQRFIVKNFPVKSSLRSDVLSQFLYGSKLRVEEFRTGWIKIQEKFKAMLIRESDGDSFKLRVIPEQTDVLEEMFEELKLPDPRLGHLFWALFWHDKLQNHPLQAVWMRKLTQHLLKADASNVGDEQTYVNILGRLFDALLFAVDGSMKACLFQNIRKLLETALNLLEGDLQKGDVYQKRLARLLRKCWEAYTVLGDEEILRLLLDIYDATEPGAGRAVPDGRRLLEEMFFESIPLAPDKRRRLKPDFFTRTLDRQETAESISDYARVRAAWLALTSSSQMDSNLNEFVTALIESDAMVLTISDNAFKRINAASEDSIRLTDVMTLSLALWCSALRFHRPVIEAKFQAALERGPSAAAGSALRESEALAVVAEISAGIFSDFSSLIEGAEDAVLLASQVKREAAGHSEASVGVDYLMNGLAKELCAISLGSVLVANSYLEGSTVSDDQITRINDLIRISNDFLDYSLPEISTPADLSSPEVIEKVDSLMKLCGIIWSEFGLERLRDFMNIRRIHFNAVCAHLAANDFPAYNSLLQSVGQIINNQDFSGIMANLAISESFKSAEELAAYYLIHAAEIGLSDSFGSRLKDQLCLAVILQGSVYAYDLNVFLGHLVKEAPDQPSLLLRFLKTVPEDKIEGVALRLLNASKSNGTNNTGASITEILGSFATGIASDDARKRIESLLEMFTLEATIAKGNAVDPQAVLESWADKKDLWFYPWVLETLINNGFSSPEVQRESLAILAARNPNIDSFNTYFLLSLSLATQFLNTNEAETKKQIAVEYLKEGIKKWENRVTAAIGLQIYKVLYQMDPQNRSSYLDEIHKWELIRIEGDHLKRLPRLLGQGRFFLVFQYYFESMEFWGLRTDIPSPELAAQLNIVPDQKRKLAKAWKAGNNSVPAPLIRLGGRLVVSSRFLSLGSYLFSAPNYQDATFEADRQSFDDLAKVKIAELFDMIIELPQLPISIKNLMRSHSQRLFSYTLPDA